LISKTADAYYEASLLSPASTSASYHARFLRSLVANDIFKSRRAEERHDSGMPIDPRLQGPPSSHGPTQNPAPPMYPRQVIQTHEQSFQFPASPHLPAHPAAQDTEYPSEMQPRNAMGGSNGPVNYQGYVPPAPHHASELDAHYWKNMFLELGFGEGVEGTAPHAGGPSDDRPMPQYMNGTHPHQHPHQYHPNQQHQGQVPHHHMHSSQSNYGHQT